MQIEVTNNILDVGGKRQYKLMDEIRYHIMIRLGAKSF